MFAKTSTFVKFALLPLAAVTVLSQVSSATPASLALRDDGGHAVIQFIQPCASTVWEVGTVQQVTWEFEEKEEHGEQEQKPHKRHDGEEEPEENCDCEPKLFLTKAGAPPFLILADNVDLKSGHATIKVPNVITGNDYTVVLGKITGPDDGKTPQSVTVLATSQQFRIKKECEEKEEQEEHEQPKKN